VVQFLDPEAGGSMMVADQSGSEQSEPKLLGAL
jgi:hypothetical protein